MMKKVSVPALICLLVISFAACKKDDSSTPNGNLTATNTSAIKKGEPVVFTLSQAAAGSTVNWTVTPSTSTRINKSGNQAAILFGAKGNYTVSATAPGLAASTRVMVLDSVYTGGNTPSVTLPFSAGDVIAITASRIDSGSISGLLFTASTANSYTCISNFLLANYTSGSNNYGIDFTGVSVPANCTAGTAKSTGYSFLYPVTAGTHLLTINFKGTVYTGTIVKTGNSYAINWGYNTGVTISPVTL